MSTIEAVVVSLGYNIKCKEILKLQSSINYKKYMYGLSMEFHKYGFC